MMNIVSQSWKLWDWPKHRVQQPIQVQAVCNYRMLTCKSHLVLSPLCFLAYFHAQEYEKEAQVILTSCFWYGMYCFTLVGYVLYTKYLQNNKPSIILPWLEFLCPSSSLFLSFVVLSSSLRCWTLVLWKQVRLDSGRMQTQLGRHRGPQKTGEEMNWQEGKEEEKGNKEEEKKE